jgi:aryl-alcohol dehydrogenase-like predicted oxidoreductase
MEYTTLGRTGLRVSVAGLGSGGGSRLGLSHGKSHQEAIDIVRLAIDLGINVIDTAATYGTEEVIGDALRGIDRDKIVLSTKHQIEPHRAKNQFYSAETIIRGLDDSLRHLRTDHVDIFYLHGLTVPRLAYAVNEIVPALLRERDKGKFRFLGVTEAPTVELRHEGMQQALDRDIFDVVMLGFQIFHQNARSLLFPMTLQHKVGTMLMFVVRHVFADADHLRSTIRSLAEQGQIPRHLATKDNPLDFLIHDGGARDIIDAAYRYARHEPGTDVVLFGTGNPEHLRRNVDSIVAPPLPEADIAKIGKLFGELVGVGLDSPE